MNSKWSNHCWCGKSWGKGEEGRGKVRWMKTEEGEEPSPPLVSWFMVNYSVRKKTSLCLCLLSLYLFSPFPHSLSLPLPLRIHFSSIINFIKSCICLFINNWASNGVSPVVGGGGGNKTHSPVHMWDGKDNIDPSVPSTCPVVLLSFFPLIFLSSL